MLQRPSSDPFSAFQVYMPVFQLTQELLFPPPRLARADGLLAVGGDLSQERLLLAYHLGIFPWFSEDMPILWWSPDPRLVLYPADLNISGRLKRTLRQNIFRVSLDCAFRRVISACAKVRLKAGEQTWIVADMITAYSRLHEAGFAHSVEVWQGKELAGGLYGVSLGGCFFGESMFTRVSNASKVALVNLAGHLIKHEFDLIDCQIYTPHLVRMGAREIPRSRFLTQLKESLRKPTIRGKWSFDD